MRSLLPASLVCASILLTLAAELPPPPSTPKRPVTDDYHGVKVTDDYRWLENFSDPEVHKWSDAQNHRARAFLDVLPARQAISARLRELYTQTSSHYYALTWRAGALFAMKDQPPKEQPLLVVLRSVDDSKSERVVIDPNALDAKGGTAVDFYVPSVDGKLVAVSLSTGGSEDGSVHIVDVSTGRQLPDVVPRVNGATAGGSVAWNSDSSGFYYTRYPQTGERPEADLKFYQQIYFHRIGTPLAQDVYSLGKEFPRIAETSLTSSDDGKLILATVAYGDGGEFLHFLFGPWGRWRQLARLSDQVTHGAFGPDGTLYLLSKNAAPQGKILRVTAPDYDLAQAKVSVRNGKSSIAGFVPAATRLYVGYISGGPMQLRVFDLEGQEKQPVPIKPVSSITQMARTQKDELLFENESYLDPPAWFHFDPVSGQVRATALAHKSTADFSDAEVIRRFVASKDGVKVPLNIIQKKGTKLDGTNPVLLYGYGGYGVNLSPGFSERTRLWLDRGGVYAVANLRGGAEYGETWHQQGRLTKKQNVFNDFLACAEYLIASKYTTAKRLAIEGGSNGGLLMGAALTQRPDLFRAVVSHVGIYDMLRVELSPNGSFNVTEFGTVKESDQFKALYAYSPYHHVKDGVDYPAVLFLTGDNDGRVDPANSRKMTARLQAATHSGLPVLLRTSSSSGHGIGTALSELIDQDTDVFSFLFDQLGLK